MPELPEVETTRRAISNFEGKVIKSSKVNNPNLRWKIDKNFEAIVRNFQIEEISRRAKYIIFKSDTYSMLLHLGMSGSLRILDRASNQFKKHDHVEFFFEDKKIIYNDPRRFGSIHLAKDIKSHFLISKLGIEPLEKKFTGSHLFNICSKSKAPIKSLIMNQKNVVGVGNIYACESLFEAKINPFKESCCLSEGECASLVKCIKKILRNAIKVGGTTLKDFYSADGSAGYFKFKLKAYGREDEDCLVCNDRIMKTVQNQRATYYCSTCQV